MTSSTEGVGGWARRVLSATVSGAVRAASGVNAAVPSAADSPDVGRAKKSVTQKSVAKKPVAKKPVAVAKTPAAAAKQGTAKKPVAKKPAMTPAKNRAAALVRSAAVAKAAPAKRTTPPRKQAPTKAAPATKSAPVARVTRPRPATARTTRTTPTPAKVAPTAAKVAPTSLKVRENESPWTTAELREVRTELERDIARLTIEIATAETGLHELLRDSGDGAGDDQADAGAKTFEREQEISLANNSRGMLEQSRRALVAIQDSTYGNCESCGLPVGKMRLQAFPRATLCVSCKQRQERR